jgi:FkbM family methyltransferase
MSFISYAQNFEDVMLWRALKHIKQGFYIDVGANDPTIDSVTRAFYERGWRGLNIEPLMSHYKDLQAERPLDINLCCAAGEASGEIDIFECDIRGWATAEQSVADKYVREGHEGVYHRVPLRTLSDICREYVSGEIHFLKIDVEGMEKKVISGADFRKFRPWIVVIEAITPHSTEEAHEQWECLLFAVSYQFAYADGVNRFYVTSERSDLLTAFKYPPHVFDNFTLNVQRQAKARSLLLENELPAVADRNETQTEQLKIARDETMRIKGELLAQQHALAETEAKARETSLTLHNLCNSRSWRITAPLRWCGNQVRLVLQHQTALRLKALLKKIFKPEDSLQPLSGRCPVSAANQLSPLARRIYADLKAAIEHRRKGTR